MFTIALGTIGLGFGTVGYRALSEYKNLHIGPTLRSPIPHGRQILECELKSGLNLKYLEVKKIVVVHSPVYWNIQNLFHYPVTYVESKEEEKIYRNFTHNIPNVNIPEWAMVLDKPETKIVKYKELIEIMKQDVEQKILAKWYRVNSVAYDEKVYIYGYVKNNKLNAEILARDSKYIIDDIIHKSVLYFILGALFLTLAFYAYML